MTDTHVPLMPLGNNKQVYVPMPPRKQRKALCEDLIARLTGVFPARYMFAVLASISFAIIYGLKVNLSVAIVTMVNHTYLTGRGGASGKSNLTFDDCGGEDTGHKMDDGPFEWTETTQGLILGSYFWGYLVSQMPGGRLAELYSAKYVMLVAVLMNVVGCLLSPVSSSLHYFAFIVMRVIQGIGGGLTFPAMHVLISHWSPPAERSIISAIIYSGTSIGTVISTVMSGQVSEALGWEWVFYLMGILSLFWCVLWVWLINDYPSDQRYITPEERKYITESLGQEEHSGPRVHPAVPWKAVFKSFPFYAILISHFCSNCGWYMVLTQLPTFMKQVLKFHIKENALLSALPYLCMWLFSMFLSKTLDHLRGKGKISTGVARKISTGIASVLPAICLVAVGFVGCNKAAGVALMTVSVMCMGGMFCGFLANHIDIASNFAGTLMAITNTIATIPGITVPVLVGYLTESDQSIRQWRKIFFGSSAIFVFSFLVFTIFGSGEEQAWNKVPSTQHQPEADTGLHEDEEEKKE